MMTGEVEIMLSAAAVMSRLLHAVKVGSKVTIDHSRYRQ